MKSKDSKYWFRPKRFGYGAYPTTWQGWMTILTFIVLLYAIVIFLSKNRYIFYISVVLLIIVMIYISYIKTKGKWAWRWDGK